LRPAVLAGFRPDPAMLWVAVYAFMKPANCWPRACFSLQVAERGAENIRASERSVDRTCVAALGRGANARAAGQQRLARTRGRVVVWLLVSAMAALGTADAFAGSRLKHVPAHRSKAAEAERHKHGSASDAKRSAAARKSVRNRTAGAVVPSIPPADCLAGRGIAAAGSCRDEAGDRVGASGQAERSDPNRDIDRRSGGAEARGMDAAAPP
jgi:hypothetical protein